MTPTLRKLYHRRGKLLSYLNEIDRQIEELTPQKGDLVVYENNEDLFVGICSGRRSINPSWIEIYVGDFKFIRVPFATHLTILEKGFER